MSWHVYLTIWLLLNLGWVFLCFPRSWSMVRFHGAGANRSVSRKDS